MSALKYYFFLFLLLWSQSAFAALSIDGTAQGTTTTITLSTSNGSDIIILQAKQSTPSACPAINSISDTAGLTWVLRGCALTNSGSGGVMDEWYAVAPSALSSDVITPAWNGTPSSQRIVSFGVHGGNTTTPFDTNVSWPQTISQASSVTSQGVTVSTNNANDMLVQFQVGSLSSFGTVTPPAGFNTIVTSGSTFSYYSYDIISSILSSQTLTWSWSGSAAPMGMIVDAIQSASAGPISSAPISNQPIIFRPF